MSTRILLGIALLFASAFPAAAQRTYIGGPIKIYINQDIAPSGAPCVNGRTVKWLQEAATEVANQCDIGPAMPIFHIVSLEPQAIYMPQLVGSWQAPDNVPTIEGELGASLWCPFIMASSTPWKLTKIAVSCSNGGAVYDHYGSILYLQPPMIIGQATNAINTNWGGTKLEFLKPANPSDTIKFVGQKYNSIFYAIYGSSITTQAVTFDLTGVAYNWLAAGSSGGVVDLGQGTVIGGQGQATLTDGTAYLNPPANGWPQ